VSRVKKFRAEKRHIAKTFSWRVIGTIDTVLISWWLTGDILAGFQIGVAELITKMTLYYFHERVWFNIDMPNSNLRHIFKTITWRVVGTIDTVFIAWIITGDARSGLEIGVVELISKTILYYTHERIWHKSTYGLEKL
jgi:uncharacterized membrane protein